MPGSSTARRARPNEDLTLLWPYSSNCSAISDHPRHLAADDRSGRDAAVASRSGALLLTAIRGSLDEGSKARASTRSERGRGLVQFAAWTWFSGSDRLRAMTDELLYLSGHETVRLIHETPAELEVEGTWAAGGSPPPLHLHPAQDERFEVRSGHLVAVVDGEERRLGPGDTLQIPRGTPHKMWNAGGETATAVWSTRPGGRTAQWFRTVDRLGNGGMRKPPLPAMARALTNFSDVFRLSVGPSKLRPLIHLALRIMALADH